jgi:Flp pilus assembly protein TadB
MSDQLLPVLPVLAGCCAAVGLALALPIRRGLGLRSMPLADPDLGLGPERADPGLLHRWRALWSVLAAVAGVTFFTGPVGLAAGICLGVGTWVVIGRSEPAGRRREREAAARQLPLLVDLFAIGLAGGAAPPAALLAACSALPGPAAQRLSGVRAQLALGVDPGPVWAALATDSALAPLGRAMSRAHASGASVADIVARLSTDLGAAERAAVEGRARAVGVRAAVPLGICLLPAFLLLGVVPVVAGLLTSLGV